MFIYYECFTDRYIINLFFFIFFPRGNVGEDQPSPPAETPAAPPAATVIPGVDSLIGDLLDMDLGGPSMQQQQMYPPQPTSQTPVQGGGNMDLLGEGLDSLVSIFIIKPF